MLSGVRFCHRTIVKPEVLKHVLKKFDFEVGTF